ncbi:MAG: protein-export chaperone SecB [Arsenophonus sp.]
MYTKDILFETPSATNIFQKEWQPKIKLDLDTSSIELAEHVYEVRLLITVITRVADETASCVKHNNQVFSMSIVSRRKQNSSLFMRLLPQIFYFPMRVNVNVLPI